MRLLIHHFSCYISHLSRTTQRLYLSSAKHALAKCKLDDSETTAYQALPAIKHLAETSPPSIPRIQPFIRFLETVTDTKDIDREGDIQLANSVLANLKAFLDHPSNTTMSRRRDAALIAATAYAPRRNDARRWPIDTLKLDKGLLFLWSNPVQEEPFRHALRLWLQWRSRLGRRERQYLFPNQNTWYKSNLLFPGPKGQLLSRTALHNALKRLPELTVGEGTLTLEKLRRAFLVYWNSRSVH